jgi:hypothetical protein
MTSRSALPALRLFSGSAVVPSTRGMVSPDAQRNQKAMRLPEGLDGRSAVQRAHLGLRAPRYDRVEVLPGLSWIG